MYNNSYFLNMSTDNLLNLEFSDYNNRIDYLIKHLCNNKKKDFASLIKKSPSYVSEIFTKNHKLSEKSLTLLDKAGVNINWLLTGKGMPMLQDQQLIEPVSLKWTPCQDHFSINFIQQTIYFSVFDFHLISN